MERTKKILCIFIALVMILGSMATCLSNVVYAIEDEYESGEVESVDGDEDFGEELEEKTITFDLSYTISQQEENHIIISGQIPYEDNEENKNLEFTAFIGYKQEDGGVVPGAISEGETITCNNEDHTITLNAYDINNYYLHFQTETELFVEAFCNGSKLNFNGGNVELKDINGEFKFQINTQIDNPIEGRENLVELELNRATNVTIDNNVATITYDNGTVNVSGDSLQSYRNDNWNYGDGNIGTKYLLYTTSTNLTFNIIPSENYSARYWIDGNEGDVENNTCTFSDLSLGNHYSIEFIFENNNSEEVEHNNFNTTANINVSAGTGTWTITRHNPETGNNEEEEKPYDTANVAISINNGEMWDSVKNSPTISYNSEETDDTVDFTFETMWTDRFYEDIVINGTSYTVSNYLDFDNRTQWLNANHGSQTLSFTIANITKADTYDIVVKHGENNGTKYSATFLWTADPEQADGHDYIGHSKLEFVKAEYEVGGTEYTVTENDIEGNLELEGNFDNFHSADGFLQYGTTHGVDFDDGSLTLPGNAKVTMRVVPDYGYQVTSVNGGGDFITTDEGVSEFTVVVAEGEAGYFQATVEEIDNEVTPISEKVRSGEIELGSHAAEDIKNGTVRLSVEDIELSSDKIADFQDEANKAGNYTISNYLDINLNKVLYRGNANNVWSEQVHRLTDKALITLQLDEDVDVNNIVIVHNIDNGDQFEIIQIESYYPETNTITFYTDSFSNFAIAQRNDDIGEPEFTVTYDFNGGNRHGESKYITTSVGFVPVISVENFIDWMEVTAPSGKELDAIEINGLRYELGSYYELNKDTTYKYLWKNTIETHTHSYKTTITKATLSKNGSIITKCTCGDIKSSTLIYYPKTISLSKTSFTYNKKVQKPTVTVKGSNGKVIPSSNYTVTYSNKNSKAVGEYKITIKFKGSYYEGTKTLTYKIIPKGTSISKLKAAKKKFTATWKKQATETTGYEIQYSTNKNFKSGNKTVNITKNKTTSKAISKLKAKKKYYVRVRTYKKVGSKKIYSSWSGIKSVTTKK